MKLSSLLQCTDFPIRILNNKGNLIYSETAEGYWQHYIYDAQGRVTHFETSTGDWKSYEFDADGNQTLYKTSDGITRVSKFRDGEKYYERCTNSKNSHVNNYEWFIPTKEEA